MNPEEIKCPGCSGTNIRKAPIVEQDTGVSFYCSCKTCGIYFRADYKLNPTGVEQITKFDMPRRSLDALFQPRQPEELPDVIETCYER